MEAGSLDSTGMDTILPLRFVDLNHPGPKKKKAHKKSRGGCTACKRRKVKCDERLPCANCLRRNEKCCPSSQKPSSPENEALPAFQRSIDLSGPVNLLHMELFHHFQHTTVPTLCFADLWMTAIPLAFKEEYLMTAILAVSAKHLSILRPQETVYAQAAMALLSRSCAAFSAVLDRDEDSNSRQDRDDPDPLLLTAVLIHHLAWCDLEFLGDQRTADHGGRPLDLGGDRLFLLSSGVRVFLAGTRAPGSKSIFVSMSSTSQCGALDAIVDEGRAMDRETIIEAFVERCDELTASDPDLRFSPRVSSTKTMATAQETSSHRADEQERSAYRGIIERLSVILALSKLDSVPPLRTSDVERFVFSFPLFCFGRVLEMITTGDSRALLVLYHFYRTSRLLLRTAPGAGVQASELPWWAAERLEVMEGLAKQELESRSVKASVAGLG